MKLNQETLKLNQLNQETLNHYQKLLKDKEVLEAKKYELQGRLRELYEMFFKKYSESSRKKIH